MSLRLRTGAAVAAASLLLAAPLLAQPRQEQVHDFDSAEGRLLGFYAASLLFTPVGGVGAVAPGAPARMTLGVELAYVPQLTERQRATGDDKPQNSNLAPAFPRPRLSFGLPRGALLEASWLPPVRVFDVKSNLVNVALSAPLGTLRGVALRGRLAAPYGYVQGAITCSDDVASEGGPDLQLYYAVICNGRESQDRFEPRHVAAEVVAAGARSYSFASGAWVPWAALGVRREWTRFDIGVIRDDGSREPDHPILVLHATRAHGSIGAAWSGPRGTSIAAEALYAPGSLVTTRVYAGVRR